MLEKTQLVNWRTDIRISLVLLKTKLSVEKTTAAEKEPIFTQHSTNIAEDCCVSRASHHFLVLGNPQYTEKKKIFTCTAYTAVGRGFRGRCQKRGALLMPNYTMWHVR